MFLFFLFYLHKVHKRETKWVGRGSICLSECYGTGFCRAQIVRELKSISNFPKQLVEQKKIVYIIKHQLYSAFKLHVEHFSVSQILTKWNLNSFPALQFDIV